MDISIKKQSRNLLGIGAIALIAYIIAIAVPVPGLVIGASIFVAGIAALYVGLGLAHLNETSDGRINSFFIFLPGLATLVVLFSALNYLGSVLA